MGGIRDDVRCKVYPEVEVDDDLGVGLGLDAVASIPIAAVVVPVVMVGIYDAGPSFLVGSA